MAGLNTRAKAQEAALRGEVETAQTAFEALAKKSDTNAHAALAELAAFRGTWEGVLRHAAIPLQNPTSLSTLNVYADLCSLVAVAGMHLHNWKEVEKIGKSAFQALNPATEQWGHEANAQGLIRYAKHQGRLGDGWQPGYHDDRPIEERIAKYERGLKKLAQKKKRFKNEQARRNHYISMASNALYYEAAVALYDEGGLPELFDSILFVASGLAQAERSDEAWAAIEEGLRKWWPFEDTQIAPVGLLTNEALRAIMTPQRCEEILRRPRAGR